ncbi:acyltransferase [Bradyrhizobium sp. TZ2]
MLCKTEGSDRVRTTAARLVALDRTRTFITLLVLIHHSAVNYTHFGNGDKMRWLGFDLVVLFNDSFFMACMFLISGLFVHGSLTRRGASNFLQGRAWRLGIPFLVSIFVLMPIAYYPTFPRYHLPGTTDFNFFHFWWRTLTVGPLALGSGMVPVGAAGARCRGRRAVGARPAHVKNVRRNDCCASGRGRPSAPSCLSRSRCMCRCG